MLVYLIGSGVLAVILAALLSRCGRTKHTRGVSAATSLPDLCRLQSLGPHCDKVLLRDGSCEWSFRQFHDAAMHLADWLVNRLGRRHDLTAVFVTANSPDVYVGMMASWQLGWTVALLAPDSPLPLLHRQARAVRADVIIVATFDPDAAGERLAALMSLPLVRLVDFNAPSTKEPVQGSFAAMRRISGSKCAAWIASSASSDSRAIKMIALSHAAILASCSNRHRLYGANGIGPGDTVLLALPISHVSGLVLDFINSGLYSGATLALRPSRARPALPTLILDDVVQSRATILHTVPWILNAWSDQLATSLPASTLALRAIICLGAPLDIHIGRSVQSRLGVAVLSNMGATEVAGTIMSGLLLSPSASALRPYDGWMHPCPSVRITLRPLPMFPLANSGSLRVQRLVEGIRMRRTRVDVDTIDIIDDEAVFDDEGWFEPGDLFEIAADGAFRFICRTDALLLLPTGVAISPGPIEQCIKDTLACAHVCIILHSGRIRIVVQWAADEVAPVAIDYALLRLRVVSCAPEASSHLPALDAASVTVAPPDWIMPINRKGEIQRQDLKRLLDAHPDHKECVGPLTETSLRDAIVSILGCIDSDDLLDTHFQKLGLTSIMSAELLARLPTITAAMLMRAATPRHLLYNSPTPIARNVPLACSTPPLAIIGAACRLPCGIDDLDTLWAALSRETNLITRADAPHCRDRASLAGLPADTHAGFLSRAHVDEFDENLFGLSANEAIAMDPAARVLLATCWSAVDNAQVDLRHTPTAVLTSVVDRGHSIHVYAQHLASKLPYSRHAALAGEASSGAGRIAHCFHLSGPNANISSACSSGATLLSMAADALRDPSVPYAIIAGSCVLAHSVSMEVLKAAGVLSRKQNRSAVFDVRADGYAPSESCIVMVVRRASDAVRDRQRVLGLVTGVSLMHNGGETSGVGVTAPSQERQAECMRAAMQAANTTPDQIDLVEAHGTGTVLGDPIEVGAIASAFAGRQAPLLIGAVKATVGHTENNAALMSLLKVLVALDHNTIPPTRLDAGHARADLCATLASIGAVVGGGHWGRGRPDRPRQALIACAGLAGTVGSIVVQEAPPMSSQGDDDHNGGEPWTLALAAHCSTALAALVALYIDALPAAAAEHGELDAHRLCHLTNRVRPALAHRQVWSFSSLRALTDAMMDTSARSALPEGVWAPSPPVVIVIPGQGGNDAFKPDSAWTTLHAAAIARCHHAITAVADATTANAVLALGFKTDLAAPLQQARLMAIQYCQYRAFISANVGVPIAFIGASFGEVVAALLAGAWTLEEAFAFALHRGRVLCQPDHHGRMLAVFVPVSDVTGALTEGVDVAAVMGPAHTIVSGAAINVEEFERSLPLTWKTFPVDVSYAFHSRLMAAAAGKDLFPPTCAPLRAPLVSSMTGELIDRGVTLSRQHWIEHVTRPTLFKEAMEALCARFPTAVLIELGPVSLARAIERMNVTKPVKLRIVACSNGPYIDRPLAQLFALGINIAWPQPPKMRPSLAPLPTYPMQPTLLTFTNPIIGLPAAQPPTTTSSSDEIAIVGVGVRLPGGVCDLKKLWRQATRVPSQEESLRRFPPTATAPADRPDALFPDRIHQPARWLEDGFALDTHLFSVAPDDVDQLDPTYRVLLETSYHALEHAGITMGELATSRAALVTASPISAAMPWHRLYSSLASNKMAPDVMPLHQRLAEALQISESACNFSGSCESGFHAMTRAVQELQARNADLVVTCTAQVFTCGKALSVISNLVNGNTPGLPVSEGAVVMVLKRLSDCTGRDRVLGVIEATAEVRGHSAYERAITRLLQAADITAKEVDLIELNMKPSTFSDSPLPAALVTLRPDIHMSSAGSTVGSALISKFGVSCLRALLFMQHRFLPPNSLLKQTGRSWADRNTRRCIVDTNGIVSKAEYLVLLKKIPEAASFNDEDDDTDDGHYLLVISARSPQSLGRLIESYIELLLDDASPIGSLCRATRIDRAHHPFRVAITGRTPAHLLLALVKTAPSPGAPSLPARFVVIVSSPELDARYRSWAERFEFVRRHTSLASLLDAILLNCTVVTSVPRARQGVITVHAGTLAAATATNGVDISQLDHINDFIAVLFARHAADINFPAIDCQHVRRSRSELPLYPFHRPHLDSIAKRQRLASMALSVASHPWLLSHQVESTGRCIVPIACIAILSARFAAPAPISLHFLRPVTINDDELRLDIVAADRPHTTFASPGIDFLVVSVTAAGTIAAANLRIHACDDDENERPAFQRCDDEGRSDGVVDMNAWYRSSSGSAIKYGPEFRLVSSLRADGDQFVALLDRTIVDEDCVGTIGPVTLDACLHMMAATSDVPSLPLSIDRLRLFASASNPLLQCRHTSVPRRPSSTSFVVHCRATGECIAAADAFTVATGESNPSNDSQLSYPVWSHVQLAQSPPDDLFWIVVGNIGDSAVQSTLSSLEGRCALLSLSLLAALPPPGRPLAILHIPSSDAPVAQDWIRATGADRLLALVQELIANHAHLRPVLIAAITKSAYRVVETDSHVHGAQRSVVALLLNITAELSWPTVVLDCDENKRPVDLSTLVASASTHPHRLLASRLGRLYACAYHPLSSALPSVSTLTTSPHRGTIMITGGAGGLGLGIARHLLKRSYRVVLVGRRAIGDVKGAIDSVLPGATSVSYLQCDCTDGQAVKALLVPLLPSLHGIVHAAVILSDTLLGSMQMAHMDAVMAPKLNAALAILCAVDQTDTTVIFLSSIASIIGSPGQTNYVLANASLDALAAEREDGARVFSLQVGLVEDVGIGARASRTHVAIGSVSVEQVAGTVSGILEQTRHFPPVLAIAPRDALERTHQSSGVSHSSSSTTVTADEFVNSLLERVLGGQTVLGDARVPMGAKGVDSIGLAEMRASIAQQYNVQLSFGDLNDHSRASLTELLKSISRQ